MAEFTISLLESLNYNFTVDQKSTTEEFAVIRTAFQNSDEVCSFVQDIQKRTNTNFRIKLAKQNMTRMLFRKKWICQHSTYRKRPSSEKNAQCESFIDASIKNVTKDTVKRDSFLKMEPPLACVLKMNLSHRHDTECADALRRLDVLPEIIKEFEEYFKSGMSVCDARRLHEDKLVAQYGESSRANSSINPTDNQIYYIYNKWRNENFGPICNPLSTLKEKMSLYENEGAIVRYHEGDPWSILVITPVMKRAQELLSSKEIVFLDSTSGCETTGSTFTVLVTATKAGGIPIAVLLHPNQTTESYSDAFTLLEQNAKFCFGGQEAPAVFMTDDSAAEKNALLTKWPSARQLLCHFHVAQAEWRWLISSSSDVCPSERQHVMKLFQAVMYADTLEKLESGLQAILELEEKYPKFVNRFKKFFERRKEWIKFDRLNTITRDHNTNNISEAAIRVIKEIVLSRTKAYNVIALLDYIINVFDKYLSSRLLKIAYNRGVERHNLYEEFMSKMNDTAEVEEFGDNLYLVPSSKNKNIRYIVNTNIGYCTCISGKTGAFCKHQFFLMDKLKLQMPNAPCTSAVDRFLLAKVALGPECPDLPFFKGFTDNFSSTSDEPEQITCIEDNRTSIEFEHLSPLTCVEDNHTSIESEHLSPILFTPKEDEKASEEDKAVLKEQIDKLLSFNLKKSFVNKLSRNMKNYLKSVQNDSSVNEKILRMNAVFCKKRARKIRVQPTSISRRRKGTTKRSTAIPAGRPNKSTQKEKRQKRKHSLKENIEKNVKNATK